MQVFQGDKGRCQSEKKNNNICEYIKVNPMIKIGQVNALSVENNTDSIRELIDDHYQPIDLLTITETWLSIGSNDLVFKGDFTPSGYTYVDIPRCKGKGGGGWNCSSFSSSFHVKHRPLQSSHPT